MKIVDRKTFLQLPAGTMYCKAEMCCFGEVEIKTSEDGLYANDWLCVDLTSFDCFDSGDYTDKFSKMWNGESLDLSLEQTSRNGFFDDDDVRFMIYDKSDLEKIAVAVQSAIDVLK